MSPVKKFYFLGMETVALPSLPASLLTLLTCFLACSLTFSYSICSSV